MNLYAHMATMLRELEIDRLAGDLRIEARMELARSRRTAKEELYVECGQEQAHGHAHRRDVRWARLTSAQLPPDDGAALEWRGGAAPQEGA